MSGPERRAAAWLAAAALLSMLVVYHPAPGWGVNSRLDLVFAVVDEGRFTIDSYHDRAPTQTNDKAFYEGHFYSDKIFGVSLLALPVYAGLRAVGALLDWRPDFHQSNYALRAAAVSLPAAASLALCFALLLRLGAPPRRALLAAAVAFWGSLWFGFSTTFFPYAPGIAATLAAYALLLGGPLSIGRAASIGGLCGFAMLCDLSFGFAVLGLVAIFALRVGHDAGYFRMAAFDAGAPKAAGGDGRLALRWLAAGALAGLAALSLFVAYSVSIFGSPTIPYEYEYLEGFRTSMAQGVMGIGLPKPAALWFLTVHPYRGLFFWSPWVLLALWGLARSCREGGTPALTGALGLWCFAAYLVANAGYYMWWGGWCMGSRFLLPIFAFAPLGLANVVRTRGGFIALCVAGALSVGLSAPLSLLDPETPMVNDYGQLLAPTFGSDFAVPQFAYLRTFYAAASWSGGGDGTAVGGLALLALGLPALLLAFAWRQLPEASAGQG